MLVLFFVMAANIGAIKRQVTSLATHDPTLYTCHHCKSEYKGKHVNCPHCGTKQTYS